jgi:hypothetical protein
MKTIIFSLLLLSGTTLFAQNDRRYNNNNSYNSNGNYNAYQAPQRVRQGWQRDHADNSNPQWEKRRKHWDAHYIDQANHNVDAYYDKRGRLVDTHRELDRNDIPADFDDRIRSRYRTNNYRVTRIDRPGSTSLFQIILNLGSGSRTVYWNEQGNEVRYRDRH